MSVTLVSHVLEGSKTCSQCLGMFRIDGMLGIGRNMVLTDTESYMNRDGIVYLRSIHCEILYPSGCSTSCTKVNAYIWG